MITGAYLHSANCADNTPQQRVVFDELRAVLNVYWRDTYAKYVTGNQGAIKGHFTAL